MKHLLSYFFLFFVGLTYAQQVENVDFTHVKSGLSFNVDSSKVYGLAEYNFKILKAVDSVYLDALAMGFDDVLLNDKKTNFKNDGEKLIVYSELDRKSTRLNSSHVKISYAVF